MLGLPWFMIAHHEVCCLVLCMGLSGLAVGLGARMPDLRESSAAKISSGFGGTLTLVISSLFIMAVVVVAAVPTHLFLLTTAFGSGLVTSQGAIAWAAGPWGMALSLAIVILLGFVAATVPMMLGLRFFRQLEV
jgi:ABC-2 type transport system permease protein